ncbi:MAG: hypothetical protein J6S43_00855 [Lentisphaeria bacterium]|nr:hypothetical protein [Lentisphaeria bacterium]
MSNIRKFRNGLIVRMPDTFPGAVAALPALLGLKRIIPEYCGLFVISPGKFNQLFRALPMVDGIVPLMKSASWWSRDEFRMVRQFHAGAAVLFKRSVKDHILLKAAGIPQIISFAGSCEVTAAAAGAECCDLMPELRLPCHADELTGGITGLFNHPRLLSVFPGPDGVIMPEFFSGMKGWISDGGIVVICGMYPAAAGTLEACHKQLPKGFWFNCSHRLDLFAQMYTMRFSAKILTADPGYRHLACLLGAASKL